MSEIIIFREKSIFSFVFQLISILSIDYRRTWHNCSFYYFLLLSDGILSEYSSLEESID